MREVVQGGRPFYGEAIGILMLDTKFPRIPGDVGNATTFDFPVRYKVVRGATASRVVETGDQGLINVFIEAAKELEEDGVRAITTSCGFLLYFQEQMANALRIPIFTSSLLQIPVVYRALGTNSKIGVLTANDKTFPEHLKKSGIMDIPLVVKGAQDEPDFYNVFIRNSQELNIPKAEAAVVRMAQEIVAKAPEVGAFVCEGTNFSSFGWAVQEATGRPFFDIITMTRWVYEAIVKERRAWGSM